MMTPEGQEREYLLYFHDGRVRRVFGKLSEFQKLPVARIEEWKGEMTGSNPHEGQEIKIPTPQLQDVYKRWKGLPPTGVEEVDRAREYYIGQLRKELQKREALSSDNPGQRSLRMPEGKGISPAVVIPIGLGLGLAAVLGTLALAQAAPPAVYTCPVCGAEFSTPEELEDHMATAHPPVEPSAYLIALQAALAELGRRLRTYGESDLLFMVPGWGLNTESWSTYEQIKSLMVGEAISIGLIGSSADCYFADDHMYYTDGTLIV